ncbi:MAG TPA: hypothetical protein VKE92_15480, partial [Anaerolineales bacterium]|nr:hypothetical protein [Anaerolineales bacterium]
ITELEFRFWLTKPSKVYLRMFYMRETSGNIDGAGLQKARSGTHLESRLLCSGCVQRGPKRIVTGMDQGGGAPGGD